MNLTKAIEDSAEKERIAIENEIEALIKNLKKLLAQQSILKAHILINGISRQSQDSPVEKSGQ